MMQCPDCGEKAAPMEEHREKGEDGLYRKVDNEYICWGCCSLWVINRYIHTPGAPSGGL